MLDSQRAHVAYRAIALAAALLVFGLLFRQLATLFLAVLMTVIIAIPLAAGATRLERFGIPRPVGAFVTLSLGLAVLGGALALVIPEFVSETNKFVNDVPGIVDNLEKHVRHITHAQPGEIGSKVQHFLRRYTKRPERLIGPITSIGLNVAGVLAAIVLITVTAFYMAVRPRPLVDGALRLVPPDRRDHALHIMERLRAAWIGWMQGVILHMFISLVVLYVGLSIIGLDFAIVFAVLSALLVVVPYFGTIAGAIPPILFGLTNSPGKALAVLAVYVIVNQIEGNVIIPLVMARTVKLHPALIAIGVVVVGELFGVVGLLVAVPVISMIVILTEELWVKQIEATHERHTKSQIEVRRPGEPLPEEEREPV